MRDETALTSYIASALDGYVKNSGRKSYTAHTTKQGLKNFTKKEVFPDIIKQISESNNILLEIKIRDFQIPKSAEYSSKLKDYKAFQATFYNAMEECGVPIYYSYNMSDRPQHGLGDPEILEANSATLPSIVKMLKGYFHENFETDTLRKVVDGLIRDGDTAQFGETAPGVLFPFSALPPEQQGLRYALLTYTEQEGLRIFDESELRLVGNYLSRNLEINVLKQKVPITHLDKEGLKYLFLEYREQFRLFLQEKLDFGGNSIGPAV